MKWSDTKWSEGMSVKWSIVQWREVKTFKTTAVFLKLLLRKEASFTFIL